MAKLGERVERLESLLGQFIVNTDVALRRLETSIEAFKEETRIFQEEMKAFKDEVNEDRKKMYRMWGEIANRMGTLVEDIVAPNIPGIAKRYFGMEELEFFCGKD